MEADLVITIGMDYACQFWVRDHREDPLPLTYPCRMTVRDRVGAVLFTTYSPAQDDPDDPADDFDMASVPLLAPSEVNGMLQLTIPRIITSRWKLGNYYYDVWGTVMDQEATALFPNGQQVPVAKGRFLVGNRITDMEGGW